MTPDIESLIKANHELLLENNLLLKKMERRAVLGMWLKGVLVVVFFILPLLLLPYLLNTYLSALTNPSGAESINILQTLDEAQQTIDFMRGN